MKRPRSILGLLALSSLLASVASATPTAAEQFATDVASQGAVLAGYAGTAMAGGLVVFAIIYGGRITIKAFRSVAK